jgi:PTH1 family peptidyl-tRNA hydrolase
MKYLIVGLGNPGVKYENTRHNIGFKVLDALAESSNTSFKEEKHAYYTSIKHKSRIYHLIKPITFMNLSGKALNYWMQHLKVKVENVLVVTDDIALPFGVMRLRGKGSDGGHNGLKDINYYLGHTKYARLRFGVGDQFLKGQQAQYVLSEWTTVEEKDLSERIQHATKMVLAFGTIGLARTMSDFNGK